MQKWNVEITQTKGDKIHFEEVNVPCVVRIFDNERRLVLEWRSPPEMVK